jgi:hypothetical protein
MQRFFPMAFTLAFLSSLTIPLTLHAQERSPELQRLDYLVGQWEWDSDAGSGTMICDWLGSRVLKCQSDFTFPDGNTSQTVSIMRYNVSRKCYTWVRYWGHGVVDDHWGWVDGNTWSWTQRDSAGAQYRFVMVEDSPTYMSTQAYQSVDGGDWVHYADMTATKVH